MKKVDGLVCPLLRKEIGFVWLWLQKGERGFRTEFQLNSSRNYKFSLDTTGRRCHEKYVFSRSSLEVVWGGWIVHGMWYSFVFFLAARMTTRIPPSSLQSLERVVLRSLSVSFLPSYHVLALRDSTTLHNEKNQRVFPPILLWSLLESERRHTVHTHAKAIHEEWYNTSTL